MGLAATRCCGLLIVYGNPSLEGLRQYKVQGRGRALVATVGEDEEDYEARLIKAGFKKFASFNNASSDNLVKLYIFHKEAKEG